MRRLLSNNLVWILSILFLFSIVGITYGFKRTDFWQYFLLFILSFSIYIYAIRQPSTSWKFWLWAGVITRLCLLFHLPNLSDDIYRFIWDGRLWVNGIHPFEALPSYYIQQDLNIPNIDAVLYNQLNSPEYFTIYPPVAQFIFFIACWIFPNHIFGSMLVMKSFLFAFECGTIYLLPRLLQKYELSPHHVLIYALNPLAILEVVGNLHFEGAMIFFLILGWWYLVHQKIAWSASAFAFSIASKLLPLMFLPFLLRRLRGWNFVLFFGILGAMLVLCFFPLWHPSFLDHFGSSLNLYFKKFEFNASLYYLVRSIGFELRGYNLIHWIGPRLALITLLGIMLYTILEKSPSWKNLPYAFLFAIVLYLCCATTIHPWYTLLPLVICTFTRFRFPVIWTEFIFFTYINYSYTPYVENLWVVGIEYIFLTLLVLLEYFFKIDILKLTKVSIY